MVLSLATLVKAQTILSSSEAQLYGTLVLKEFEKGEVRAEMEEKEGWGIKAP